jgi:disulfide bond formation protein DsbB
MVFKGSGECAKIVWSFLGISMPGWVLIWMVILTFGGLLVNWAVKKP